MPLATPVQHVHAHAHVAAHRGIDKNIVRLINRARRRYGLPVLHRSRGLAFMATLHSMDMAQHHELSHSSSNGASFAQRLRLVSGARVLGETIAAVPRHGSARTVVRAWLRSPPHRAELLSPSFHAIGVGAVTVRGARLVTADFAS